MPDCLNHHYLGSNLGPRGLSNVHLGRKSARHQIWVLTLAQKRAANHIFVGGDDKRQCFLVLRAVLLLTLQV